MDILAHFAGHFNPTHYLTLTDEDYIADNLRKLNTFPDVSRKHWAYYAVMEAANTHTAIPGDSESWGK